MSENCVDISPGEVPTSGVNPYSSSISKIAFLLVLTLAGVILLALFLSILKINNGTFIYTMDDPYIGLTLSDQIRHGNYGINNGLHAAPDSSILYPFLLAVAAGTPLHPYFPLILNCLALFATIAIMWRFLEHLRLAQDSFGVVAQAAAVLLMALCLNLFGVVFTGLEHSMHIAATAAIVYGLALFLDNGEMPAWLPAVIVLGPLLRYEGLALSFGALLALTLRGRWRTVAGTFALVVLLLGSFSAFLVMLKLPPLPSSILVKSAVAADGVSGAGMGLFGSIGWNALRMVFDRVGILLVAIGVAAVVRCFRELKTNAWRWTSGSLMALVLVCLIGGHAAGGQFGWLDRYEDYALLGTALMGIYLTRDTIRKALTNKRRRLILSCATGVALSALCWRYIYSTWLVPLAANNIYEQQFQMHRFVNDFYRGPVAVNDLGLVSYHNPDFVLDLGGLSSEKARNLQLNHAPADAYRAFVAGNGVQLAVIYDEQFPGEVPASWVKVASMDLSRERISAFKREVQFYATDASTADNVRRELQSFGRSLPPGVRLTIYTPAVETASEAAKF